ncbi:hypothetical protein HaLaN_25851 [Haematococcus lacustris]|uniref:Uncharacterized protein n=1 Tax=Haematococcus lacustris TaxID=44745 RepID=A0A6A0A365_HAELA|nr:hypothetical protein HaLaN_25851 [Haematococcus lacustris]
MAANPSGVRYPQHHPHGSAAALPLAPLSISSCPTPNLWLSEPEALWIWLVAQLVQVFQLGDLVVEQRQIHQLGQASEAECQALNVLEVHVAPLFIQSVWVSPSNLCMHRGCKLYEAWHA